MDILNCYFTRNVISYICCFEMKQQRYIFDYCCAPSMSVTVAAAGLGVGWIWDGFVWNFIPGTVNTMIIYGQNLTFRYSNPSHCSWLHLRLQLMEDFHGRAQPPATWYGSISGAYFSKNYINWNHLQESTPMESVDKTEVNGAESLTKSRAGLGSDPAGGRIRGKHNNNKWCWHVAYTVRPGLWYS